MANQCGNQKNKRITPTMNHRRNNTIEYTLDIANMDNVFESLPITEEQYKGMIALGFNYEESWG